MAYLLWFFFGIHYLYLRRPGLQLLYWLTIGGLGIWALVDLFRIPTMIDTHNLGSSQTAVPAASSHAASSIVLLLIIGALCYILFRPFKTVRDVPTGPEAIAAQQRAIQRYPELGVKDSPLNSAFVAAVQHARTTRPDVFDEPEWPTLIASELVDPSPLTTDAPKAIEQSAPTDVKPGYHYERSKANGNYVPVRDGSSWRRSVGGG